MFKINIKETGTRSWRHSGVFVVNFKHISHLFLVFLLLTLNMQLPAGIPLRKNKITKQKIKYMSEL